MGRFHLLSDLRRRVRAAVGYENNQHASDSELDDEIRSAARIVFDILLEVHGPEPYRKKQVLELEPSKTIYDLALDTKDVLAVGSCVGTAGIRGSRNENQPYYELQPFEEWERFHLLNLTYRDCSSLRWRLGGDEAFPGLLNDRDQIEILPKPDANAIGLLVISYVPQPFQSAMPDSDTRLLCPGVADEYVIARVCAYIRTKENNDPNFFLAKMGEIERRLRLAQNRRTTNEPARMRDAELLLDRDLGDYSENWQ